MSYKPEQDLNHNSVSPDHRYSCHNGERDKTIAYQMQDGWSEYGTRVMREHVTQWIEMPCGHTYRMTDPSCSGCRKRVE